MATVAMASVDPDLVTRVTTTAKVTQEVHEVDKMVVAMATGGPPEAAPVVVHPDLVPQVAPMVDLAVAVQAPADPAHLVAILALVALVPVVMAVGMVTR